MSSPAESITDLPVVLLTTSETLRNPRMALIDVCTSLHLLDKHFVFSLATCQGNGRVVGNSASNRHGGRRV